MRDRIWSLWNILPFLVKFLRREFTLRAEYSFPFVFHIGMHFIQMSNINHATISICVLLSEFNLMLCITIGMGIGALWHLSIKVFLISFIFCRSFFTGFKFSLFMSHAMQFFHMRKMLRKKIWIFVGRIHFIII